jgi:selenide,water dikinase
MQAPVVKDLLLVGGGHSHIAVLRSFGMTPIPGVRVTLISRHSTTPYSGMLPGLIAGHYAIDEAHIDLVRLCRFAGARFVQGEVQGVDREAGCVSLVGRPPLCFDILSLNTGSTPSLKDLEVDRDRVIPVKPIDGFLVHWERLVDRITRSERALRIGVVGGGVGGVELLLAVEHRLRMIRDDLDFMLVTQTDDLLPEHSPAVQRRFRRIFRERGIGLRFDSRVVARTDDGVVTAAGDVIELDEVLWVTQASPPRWLAATGLTLDEQGFVLVNDCLQSLGDERVFAAGDVAAQEGSPRPKSGVFAVRQGRPLTGNLRRAVLGRPLGRFRPQRRALSLIGTGGEHAVASRGPWSAHGRWVWRWKQRIDERFMRKYNELPEMSARAQQELPPSLVDDAPKALHADAMRCGGCGAKIGSDTLEAVLRSIETVRRPDVVVGLDEPDDAALVTVPAGQLSALTVDGFRPMIDDAYVFGQIVANHCLGDLFAMGAQPQTALAFVTLPVMPEEKAISELVQMLSGALSVFNPLGIQLVGGHTSEGLETGLAFMLTGLVTPGSELRKTKARPGDALILTKPLGTGTILAADMRAKARAASVDAAVASMLLSNRAAAEILRRHGAHCATDVTGFGLAGHLLEMIKEADIGADLEVGAIPVIAGALETLDAGWLSTLHPKNRAAASRLDYDEALEGNRAFELLFDPQTSGGLLAGVPSRDAQSCLEELRHSGYAQASIIGAVTAQRAGTARKRVRIVV